jgi:hypothetical protein
MSLSTDSRVRRFQRCAEAYCSLIEDETPGECRHFAERCLRLIVDLFSQALELPDARSTHSPSGVSAAHYSGIAESLRRRFGSRDLFLLVFDPWRSGVPEAIHGSLSDGLADIWRDLKTGILLASVGNIEAAVWHWRFSFEIHWGPNHAAPMIRPLFGMLYGEHALPSDLSPSGVDQE